MPLRRKIILYLGLISGLIVLVVIIWAVDAHKLNIGASTLGDGLKSTQDLEALPSPDNSLFAKLFSILLAPFF